MTDPRDPDLDSDEEMESPAADRDEQVGPLEGLLDPEQGTSSPASDADAPAPPG